jgi:hypothetical protein
MRPTAIVTLTALSAVLTAGTIIVSADDPIAALNRSVQDRFNDVDRYFGLRRIVVIGDTPHQFRPESVAEFAAVKALEESGYRVALYLAGRRVLDREPHLTPEEPTQLDRRVIFGPVAVTDPELLPGLPQAVDLIDESRVAFNQLVKRDRYDFEIGNLKLTARAVRATADQCLSCHRGRAIGDPLGVILYAYRLRE